MKNTLFIFFLCNVFFATAQKSIQLEKQPNDFLFVGSNFQVKYDDSPQDNNTLTFDNTNVKNLLMLRYKHKNRKLLQKGYIRKFDLTSWDLLINAESQANTALGQTSLNEFTQMEFRVNAAFNFATKWDRTSFSVGVKKLPFGHQPKIDNFFNFTPTFAKSNFGFNNDLGVFARFPISENLDFDGSVTLGGYLKDPFIQTGQLEGNENTGTQNSALGNIEFAPVPYNGTFLLAGRIGSPSHKRQEVGVFGAIGKVVDADDATTTAFTTRLGGEYIYKASDHFLFSQQASIGVHRPSDSSSPTQFIAQSMTGVDYSFRGWFILSLNNSLVRKNSMETGTSDTYGSLTGTAGIVLAPNLQFRVNYQNNYIHPELTDKHGVYFQMIVGFGQR